MKNHLKSVSSLVTFIMNHLNMYLVCSSINSSHKPSVIAHYWYLYFDILWLEQLSTNHLTLVVWLLAFLLNVSHPVQLPRSLLFLLFYNTYFSSYNDKTQMTTFTYSNMNKICHPKYITVAIFLAVIKAHCSTLIFWILTCSF